MSGGWVADTFGVTMTETGAADGWALSDLVVLGLRRNRRRAHLLVSTVLGKHIPTSPRAVRAAADDLGDLTTARLGSAATRATVIGFAETATGLGHCVAARISAHTYLHSTRRRRSDAQTFGTFEEGHSHATTHLLQPTSPELLGGDRDAPVVLVDDEISTGTTALRAIRVLHELSAHDHYVVASLVDMRTCEHAVESDRTAAELGVQIDYVSLVQGQIMLPDNLTDDVWATEPGALNPAGAGREGTVDRIELQWPSEVPDGGRHGFLRSDTPAFASAIDAAADAVREHLDPDRAVVVVGHEELMYLPLCIAERLERSGLRTYFQTTTRSPAHVRDADGYPLRRGFTFTAPESDSGVPRYLYNVTPPNLADSASPATEAQPLPQVVLVADTPADSELLGAEGGLLDVLTAAGHDVCVVIVPSTSQPVLAAHRANAHANTAPLRGPGFGSYRPEEVTWLLKDLSHVALEGDLAERERRIQSGAAHYAESLPIEYQPGAEYQELFHTTLRDSAQRLAEAVGVVSELIVAERDRVPTLVSLARAGTPVGILIRRWIAFAYGVHAPHYTMSIVRDRGIDTVALDHIVAHHRPESIVFVDGWTGKGAIQRELTAALADYAAAGGPTLTDELAVLADPGSCTTTFGTRDDFLIASACLNSTVSGLVSRTVLNADYIFPGDFHGAKFYAQLAEFDVSEVFLDTVAAQFAAVGERVHTEVARLTATERVPDWSGWESVAKIQADYGLSSINFVKPGIGETTRVLLRRIPWKVLVRDADLPEHRHIRLLAAERGVPVAVQPDLAYSCVGLIKEDA